MDRPQRPTYEEADVMEVIITDSRLTKSLALRMSGWQLAGAFSGLLLALLMVTATGFRSLA